nr:M2 family metallopeptidase [Bacteroidota bacterium]
AQYYDYAISTIFLFQVHDHISRNILRQDPHSANYYGSKEVGNFLKEMMAPGATRNWHELMQEKLGSELSTAPMLEYFSPLIKYLKIKNEGREYTLPETI